MQGERGKEKGIEVIEHGKKSDSIEPSKVGTDVIGKKKKKKEQISCPEDRSTRHRRESRLGHHYLPDIKDQKKGPGQKKGRKEESCGRPERNSAMNREGERVPEQSGQRRKGDNCRGSKEKNFGKRRKGNDHARGSGLPVKHSTESEKQDEEDRNRRAPEAVRTDAKKKVLRTYGGGGSAWKVSLRKGRSRR